MTTIEEIQSSMDEVMDFAKNENRGLTQEELDKYEGLEKDLLLARKSAEAEKRNQAYKAPQSFNTLSPMGKHIKSRDSLEFAMDRFLRGDSGAGKELVSYEGKPEAKVVGINMPNQVAAFAQTETTTAGGYLVPTVTQDKLVDIQKAFGGVSYESSHISTNHGAPINFPSIDDTAGSAAIAAINAAPGSAGADLAFTQVSLGAFRYAASGTGQAGLKVPKELIDDALIDVTGLVTTMFARRLGRKTATDYVTGTGTTLPFGITTRTGNNLAPSGGLVQATAVSTLQAIVYSLDPFYRDDSCVWVMNNGTAKVLAQFVDTTTRPLLTASYVAGLAGPQRVDTLLGYRVVIDNAMPNFSATAAANPSTNGDHYMIFGNLKAAFLIRDVQGIGIAVDPYGGMSTNDVLYYGYMRTDSVIQNLSAFSTGAGFHS